MNIAALLLPQNIVVALGWTLFHSLWQGALIALGFAVVLYFSRRCSARARYAMGLAALALVLLVSLVTFWNHFDSGPANDAAAAAVSVPALSAVASGRPAGTPALGRRVAAFFSEYFSRHLPLIVTLWLLGVLFLSLRFSGGMLYVQRLKYRQNRPLPAPWPERLAALAARAGLRRPLQLLESLRLRTPVVIGHLKPVLLLPAGLVTGLSAAEVEALLAHELAHVMRRDYLVNVAQNLLEILYFFHPGVRWVSSCVRQEREHCCDDFAVALCGDPPGYARALARLQGGPAFAQPALAAVGRGKGMLRRIARLLGRPRLAHDFREGFFSALLLVLGLLGMLKLAGAANDGLLTKGAAPHGRAPFSEAAAPVAPIAQPEAAAKSEAAGSEAGKGFTQLAFVLDADGKVKLSGMAPAGLAEPAGTWIVDERDGQVVWYMALASTTQGGGGTPFSEEVPLRRGTYSWYLPSGLAATAELSGARRLPGGMVSRDARLSQADGRRRLEHELQSDFAAGQEKLAQELKRQAEELRMQAAKGMSADERQRLENELQARYSAELKHLEKEQLRKAKELQTAVEAERAMSEDERRQRQLEAEARQKAKQLRMAAEEANREHELQGLREEQNKLQMELQAMAEAEKRMNEEEKERLQAEEEELQKQLQAVSESMQAMKATELQEHEERLRLEGEREAQDMKRQEEAERQARLAENELKLAEQRLRAEEACMRDEEAKFKKFLDRLVADGLIDEKGGYEVRLSAALLFVNGKKMPPETHQKFRQLYETLTGKKLDAERPITIVHEKD